MCHSLTPLGHCPSQTNTWHCTAGQAWGSVVVDTFCNHLLLFCEISAHNNQTVSKIVGTKNCCYGVYHSQEWKTRQGVGRLQQGCSTSHSCKLQHTTFPPATDTCTFMYTLQTIPHPGFNFNDTLTMTSTSTRSGLHCYILLWYK